MNQDQSIIGLEVCRDSSSLNFINVYMPYCCDSNYDEYINYLSKISTLRDEIDSPNVLIVGDINACPNNNFGVLLSQFCLEHELKISDKINLPADSFIQMLMILMEHAAGWTMMQFHQNLLMTLSKTLKYYTNSFSLSTGQQLQP